jgi:hypothetical protein
VDPDLTFSPCFVEQPLNWGLGEIRMNKPLALEMELLSIEVPSENHGGKAALRGGREKSEILFYKETLFIGAS